MRFSLLFIPSYMPLAKEAVSEYYEQMVDLARLADHSGWYGCWFSEHHAHPYGGLVPSNVLLGAAIARSTDQIRIGSAVSVLPLNSPVHLAEQFAMLDHLSKGRVEFGIGRGFLAHEHKALGIPMELSWRLFEEAHDIIVRAWRGDRFTHHGAIWHFDDVAVFPPPFQHPHPPIWVAASRNRATFEFAGAHGYALMLNPYTRTSEEITEGIQWYDDALQAHGHGLDRRRIASTQHLFVAATEAAARDQPREALLNYLDAVGRAMTYSSVGSSTQPGAIETFSRVTETSYEDMYPMRVTFGTPERVAERLHGLEQLGVTDVLFLAHFGDLDWSLSRASLTLFAVEVLPWFRR